jgi:Photoprotection regulator fluorescence recovery protein
MLTQMNDLAWSVTEESIAKSALKVAYDREIDALLTEVKHQVDEIDQIGDLWRLHDFLSARRHDVDGKYDDDMESILFGFARLVKEGWLKMPDLDGLAKEKLAKIGVLSRM